LKKTKRFCKKREVVEKKSLIYFSVLYWGSYVRLHGFMCSASELHPQISSLIFNGKRRATHLKFVLALKPMCSKGDSQHLKLAG
jgi:hypothetical protein